MKHCQQLLCELKQTQVMMCYEATHSDRNRLIKFMTLLQTFQFFSQS